jgi:2-iminobutanoate/2-iminopropanoate deaminase
MPEVTTTTPADTPTPIGPYNHVARVGEFMTIGGTAGVDPATGALAGDDVDAQTRQIIDNLKVMLESADSDLDHVVHVKRLPQRYGGLRGNERDVHREVRRHRPARTVIGV